MRFGTINLFLAEIYSILGLYKLAIEAQNHAIIIF